MIPKWVGGSFSDDDPVACYVVDGRGYENECEIDLSAHSEKRLDWGCVTNSLEIARKWQVRRGEDIPVSNAGAE